MEIRGVRVILTIDAFRYENPKVPDARQNSPLTTDHSPSAAPIPRQNMARNKRTHPIHPLRDEKPEHPDARENSSLLTTDLMLLPELLLPCLNGEGKMIRLGWDGT